MLRCALEGPGMVYRVEFGLRCKSDLINWINLLIQLLNFLNGELLKKKKKSPFLLRIRSPSQRGEKFC